MKIDTLTSQNEILGLFCVLMTKSLTSHCSLPWLDAHAETTRHWIILVHFHFHLHSRSLLLPFPFFSFPIQDLFLDVRLSGSEMKPGKGSSALAL
jgi:hypothetical protein